ncbi:hypothetical protein [Curtobacterium sp. Curtsp57]|uniref:hypothetical protein n=1 Tax=Curtobacterium sp. Curtsp57 TaxID=3243047 RepID=UPI0039B369C3
MTKTREETVVDVWPDDFGGVTVMVRGTQQVLTIDEAKQHLADVTRAIELAEQWRDENAARAAEARKS